MNQKTHMVLSIVDQASTFHITRLIPHKDSKLIAATFYEAWVEIFGEPRELIYDAGNEFKGEMGALLERIGTRSTILPIEAHWKGGTTERHGAIFKHTLRKLIEEYNVSSETELKIAMAEAAYAKNSLARRGGFSPIQWVLGYENALPGSILSRPASDLATHQALVDGGAFAKRVNMREAARHVWIALDNSERLRRALLRQPKTQKEEFLPGEQVFFFQLSRGTIRKSGHATSDPGSWHGPAVVVGTQGLGTAWISFRQTLIKIATEHLRNATEEEYLGAQAVSEELAIQRAHLQSGSSEARGYLDLTRSSNPEQRHHYPDAVFSNLWAGSKQIELNL